MRVSLSSAVTAKPYTPANRGSNSHNTWVAPAKCGPHTAQHLTASSRRSSLAPASGGR